MKDWLDTHQNSGTGASPPDSFYCHSKKTRQLRENESIKWETFQNSANIALVLCSKQQIVFYINYSTVFTIDFLTEIINFSLIEWDGSDTSTGSDKFNVSSK